MLKKTNFFKDLLELPIAMYYMLFKSCMSSMLWGMIIAMLIVFGYMVIIG